MKLGIFALFASSITSSIISEIESLGGLKDYKKIISDVLDMLEIDSDVFEKIQSEIIPRIDQSGKSRVQIMAECVKSIRTTIDSEMDTTKALIWCSVCIRSDVKNLISVSLNDVGFSDVAAPILKNLYKNKRSSDSPESLPNEAKKRLRHFDDRPMTITNSTKIVNGLHLVDFQARFVFNGKRTEIRTTVEIERTSRRIYANGNPYKLPLGQIPNPESPAGRMVDFIDTIPAERRVAILDAFLRKLKRTLMHQVVPTLNNSAEQIYAEYILSSLYMPMDVIRILAKVQSREEIPGLESPPTASGIAEYFYSQSPDYRYITPEHILEWYHVMSSRSALKIFRGGDESNITFPTSYPTINLCINAWKEAIIAPRKIRLEKTGVEVMWELPN